MSGERRTMSAQDDIMAALVRALRDATRAAGQLNRECGARLPVEVLSYRVDPCGHRRFHDLGTPHRAKTSELRRVVEWEDGKRP